MEVKYFTKDLLVKANDEAIAQHFNRALKEEMVAQLDEDLRYPISFTMVHNDTEMRCKVILSAAGESAFIDVSFDTYYDLPIFDLA